MTTDQATFDRNLQGLTCDGYLLRCNFARLPLTILRDPTISAGAVRTYGLMVWYLHKGARYPGHATAAAEFNIPHSTLRRHLKELEHADLVQTRRHGRGNPNTYHLPDPRLTAREERSLLSIQHPKSAHPRADDRSDVSTVTTRPSRGEETLLPPNDPKQGPEYDAALQQLDQVKAQQAADR